MKALLATLITAALILPVHHKLGHQSDKHGTFYERHYSLTKCSDIEAEIDRIRIWANAVIETDDPVWELIIEELSARKLKRLRELKRLWRGLCKEA